MDVAVSALRAELSGWIARARSGEDVVITDRGLPVARLVPVDATGLLERLTREGILAPPAAPRRPVARTATRIRARGSVSEMVAEQRR